LAARQTRRLFLSTTAAPFLVSPALGQSGAAFGLRQENGDTMVWLRIDGGPMQTTTAGETLRFGPVGSGLAKLVGAGTRARTWRGSATKQT